MQEYNPQQLAQTIKAKVLALGFSSVGITQPDLTTAKKHLLEWLDKKHHGEMHYMAAHGAKRWQPESLVPGTVSVISVTMDYLTKDAPDFATLDDGEKAYIARYALGRDYHKVLKKRLQQLADEISALVEPFQARVFVDSAPVLEKPIAQQAGLGWIGKHTNLIHAKKGSWFFLGEIYTNLSLPADVPATNHCGSCQACIDVCPTQAIIAPFKLDARRCIAYLTIEHHGSIPEEFRPLIGNRVFGCDDCQLVCPWNKFAKVTTVPDFSPRHELNRATLLELFAWSEEEFLQKTEGSAIRRLGYERWLRNLAIGLGNGPTNGEVMAALQARLGFSPLVDEHIKWALGRLG